MAQHGFESTLATAIFADPASSAYAVADGAQIPDLLKKLRSLNPEHCCLYRGEIAPDLAVAAPYLVRLEAGAPFTRWFLSEGWGRHWGIVATARAEFRILRKHFRTFLMVLGPDGQRLYFRYYDPRVLRVYLPTCNASEAGFVFGPVDAYFVEGAEPASCIRFRRSGEGVESEPFAARPSAPLIGVVR